MKGVLLPLSLVCALAATIGLAVLALRGGDGPSPPGGVGANDPAGTSGESIRTATGPHLARYQTTATLVEDLRDALVQPGIVHRETWRVSRAIKTKARWSLTHLVPSESSPRVRALLVVACGVHDGESELVLGLLADAAPVVRRAAAYAVGFRKESKTIVELLGARVPLGREMSDRAVRALHLAFRGETDAEVRDAIRATLRASKQPEPR